MGLSPPESSFPREPAAAAAAAVAGSLTTPLAEAWRDEEEEAAEEDSGWLDGGTPVPSAVAVAVTAVVAA